MIEQFQQIRMSTNYILKNAKNLEHARIPCKCTNHYCYFNALFCGLQGSHSGHHVVVFLPQFLL